MSDPPRAERLADRVREIVASCLEWRIKDPRLGFVTVTGARLTSDLRAATVYYTVYGDEADRASTAAALASAKGVVRSEVGHRTGLRFTPELTFVADEVPAGAARLNELIAEARESDASIARAAEDAMPAGEADPYRSAPGADE